jgi:hypothetical protein
MNYECFSIRSDGNDKSNIGPDFVGACKHAITVWNAVLQIFAGLVVPTN